MEEKEYLALKVQTNVHSAVKMACDGQPFMATLVSTVKIGRMFHTKIVLFHSRFGVMETETTFPAGYGGLAPDEKKRALVSNIKRMMSDFEQNASNWRWAAGSEE
jgi:hypothetical protein